MRFRVKKIPKLGHVTFNGHFAREKLQLEMAPFKQSIKETATKHVPR